MNAIGEYSNETCLCTISAADNLPTEGVNTADCFQCKIQKVYNSRRNEWFVGSGVTAGFGHTCVRCKNSKYLQVLSQAPALRTRCSARPVPATGDLVAHRSFRPSFVDDNDDYGRVLREPFNCRRPLGSSKYEYISEPRSELLEQVVQILGAVNGSNVTPSGRTYQDCSCIRNPKINHCRWKTEAFEEDHPVVVQKGLLPGRHTVVQALECGQKKYMYDPTTYFYHSREKIFYQGKCVGSLNCPNTLSKVGYNGVGRVCANPGFCTIGIDGVGTTTLTTTNANGFEYDTGVPCPCPRGVHTCYWAANNSHAVNKQDMSGVTILLCKDGLSLQPDTQRCAPGCIPPYVERSMSSGSWCVMPGAADGSVSIVVNGTVLMSGPEPVDKVDVDSHSTWLVALAVVAAIVLTFAAIALVRYRRLRQKKVASQTHAIVLDDKDAGNRVHPVSMLGSEF